MRKATRLEVQRQRAAVRRNPEAAAVAQAAQETVDAVLVQLETFLAGHHKRLVGLSGFTRRSD